MTAQLTINGPIDLTEALVEKLVESMTDIGREGVAQLFANRLISGPLTDRALIAAARVFMEKTNIPKQSAEAVRKAVAKKCTEIGEDSINKAQIAAIVENETRRLVPVLVEKVISGLLAEIPTDKLKEFAMPAVGEACRKLAEKYFLQTQNGQKQIMEVINRACDDGTAALSDIVRARMTEIAAPKLDAKLGNNGEVDKKERSALNSERK